jgi:very-short-patch-repair endonuclease
MTRYNPSEASSKPEAFLENALIKIGLMKDKDFTMHFPTRSGFIIDFAFLENKLAIEVDGAPFHTDKRKENFRDYLLKRGGWKVLHFDADYLINNIDDVLKEIMASIVKYSAVM